MQRHPLQHHPPRFRRCRGLAAIAAAGLVLLATGCGHPGRPSSAPSQALPSEPAGTGNQSAVSDGALFGGNVALAEQAAKLGRKLAIVRIFDRIGDSFPGPDGPLLAAGSTALVSLDSHGAGGYAAIAAGQDDAEISSFLREVNQAAVQYHLNAIYVSFEHEPDNPKHQNLGTPAQFVAAWDHVHQLAAAEHLDWNNGGRLHWVWILIHSAFSTGQAASYWPGRDETDGIGVDGYNTLACRLARHGRASAEQRAQVTPAAIFNPAINFASSHGGLPVFLSEWGSDNPPASGTQASFIHRMQAYVTANREIAAVLYWDSAGAGCSYSVDRNPSSVAALVGMGHSRALQGHVISPR